MPPPAPQASTGIRDNTPQRGSVGDFLRAELKAGADLDIVTAYFTVFAHDKLKTHLDNLGRIRLLFGEAAFIKTIDPEHKNGAAYVLRDDDLALASRARTLAAEIDTALRIHGAVTHPTCGLIWAFEVDGFGSAVLLDDANIPSLLSLPYLGYCPPDDPLYLATRRFILSDHNPYFARGTAACGVGGPHVGLGWIWPMSIIMRALTSTDDEEILDCLGMIVRTDAGTGFMHETFWLDDPARYTRPWFAWANTLLGELVLHLAATRPALLSRTLPAA
jgi:meiotically up-regulated gene 157 (Mug157) protein